MWNFPSAATRHRRDAKQLLATSPANARYLSGYVVECALKAVVESSDALFRAPAFGHQLARLERDEMDLAVALTPRSARYRPAAATVKCVQQSWSETLRYSATSDTSGQVAARMVDAAADVHRSTVVEMFLDGLLDEPPV